MENEAGERYLDRDEVTDYLQPFDGKCWWCESTNLTGEHKFKQTDLRRMFRESENEPLVFFSDDGRAELVRGPNASIAKFDKNLCSECNNARSQQFDRAWDCMSSYISDSWRSLKPGSRIDLKKLYRGTSYDAADLTRYVAKHLGCKIAAADCPVPDDLRRYMNDPNSVNSVHIAMYFSNGRALMRHTIAHFTGIQHEMLSNGPLISTFSKSRRVPTSYVTELSVGPIGFLIKWDEEQIADRPLHRARYSLLYNREKMPYYEIHDPWPDLSPAHEFLTKNQRHRKGNTRKE